MLAECLFFDCNDLDKRNIAWFDRVFGINEKIEADSQGLISSLLVNFSSKQIWIAAEGTSVGKWKPSQFSKNGIKDQALFLEIHGGKKKKKNWD